MNRRLLAGSEPKTTSKRSGDHPVSSMFRTLPKAYESDKSATFAISDSCVHFDDRPARLLVSIMNLF